MNTAEDKNLLNLLVRSAELIEEVYERQPELIHDDHAQSYTDVVAALNARQVSYKGNPKIMQMSHDFNPLKAFGKMPMEKANPAKAKAQRKNVG